MRFALKIVLFLVLRAGFTQGENPRNLSFSYLSNYIIQPGVSLGYLHGIAETGKSKGTAYTHFLQPNISFFNQPGRDWYYMGSIEYGIKRRAIGKRGAHSLAVGLGVLIRRELTGFSVGLGSGKVRDEAYEKDVFAIPTIAYQYSLTLSERIAAYTALKAGKSILSDVSSLYVFFELGLEMRLSK